MSDTAYTWDQVVEVIPEFSDANPNLDGSGHGRGASGRVGTDRVHFGDETSTRQEKCRNFTMGKLKCKCGTNCN